jgi:transcription antitermination factor NusG
MLMAAQPGNLEQAFEGDLLGQDQNYDAAGGMVMIVVRPGYEQQARDSLRRRGVGAWWPNYKREVVAKDRENGKRYSKLVLTGIMPGIILTPSRLNSHFWASIDLAPGAVNVVRKLNGDPLIIDDTDVVLLHKIEAELNKPLPERIMHSFQVDDHVVITGDVMRHFTGKIVKIDKSGRIHLEINLFGRATALTVLANQIAPI